MKFWKWLKSLFAPKVEAPEPEPPEPPPAKPIPLPFMPKEQEKPADVIPLPVDPNWLDIARGEIGTLEKSVGENKRIIEYHMVTTLKASTDEVPWCSSFVCWCLEKAGVESTRSAWARSFLNWGAKLDKPRSGCIVVFTRGTNSGHVGFYIGETKTTIKVLGGNQSNAVNISVYSKDRLLGYRWPR